MNYATNFAIVKNGTVTNLLKGLVYNTTDDFPNAVHIEDLDVQIGDTYENGVFMRDGQVVTGGNVGVQSDWNQNDNTQPDYVKNRPCYTGGAVEAETIPATTVTFSKTGNLMTAYWPENFDFSVGQTYSISWDGTDYVCSCNLFHDIPILGNLAISNMGTDTGEPFLFTNQGKWIAISNDIVSDIATEHSICVKTFVSNIIIIEEKYLPPRLRSPLIIDATNLPTDTSGWSGLNDQLNGAYNERREILLDLLGNGSCVLPCVSWNSDIALFLKSSTDYSKINVYMLTAYVSDGGSFQERVITLTQVS